MFYVIKRNGNIEAFNWDKVKSSIEKAYNSIKKNLDQEQLKKIKKAFIENIKEKIGNNNSVYVEDILDSISEVLKFFNKYDVSEAFSKYREYKKMQRDVLKKLMKDVSNIDQLSSKNVDLMRENANVNGDTAMGQMLRVGSETKKAYHLTNSIDPEYASAHINGDIHIHDLDFYSMTTTCCQIDLEKLFKKGFDTGHGSIRPPQSIKTASNLACIVIQANQNEQHGGQSIPNFDKFMAPYVNISFQKFYIDCVYGYLRRSNSEVCSLYREWSKKEDKNSLVYHEKLENSFDCDYITKETQYLFGLLNPSTSYIQDIQRYAIGWALEKTKDETYQAMEALVHNLNTLHCVLGDCKIRAKDYETSYGFLDYSIKYIYDHFSPGKWIVLSLNKETGCIENKFITAIQKQDNNRDMIEIEDELGNKIVTTDNHKYICYDEQNKQFIDVEAKDVDSIVTPYPLFDCRVDKTEYLVKKVVGKKCFNSGEEYVYDISVEDNENFLTSSEKNMYGVFIHNSRAGSQVPFSSINFGTDITDSGRLVATQLLNAQLAGLGNGETPIFPILIYRVKDGINYKETDPNYDILQLAEKTTSVRMFPNFSFQDAPFNLQYYQEDKPETEITYMGCRTRVIGNVNDPERQISYSRGNLSFTSINLPRLAILYKQNNPDKSQDEITQDFCENYIRPKMELVKNQLLERFKYQGARTKENFPFLMKEGIWLDSENLKDGEPIKEVLKHGTFSIGFIGLAETLKELFGVHHGESDFAQEQGLKIIGYMRDFCDNASQEMKLNFTLLATPAEGLCLDGNTFVQCPKGYIAIKDLKEGDYVFSYNEEERRYAVDKVVKAGKTKTDKRCVVTFDTGQQIVCTKDHPFAVKLRYKDHHGRAHKVNGEAEYIEWRQANELVPGDRIKSCYVRDKKDGYLADSINDRYLHLTVYEDVNGKIPKQRNVHHIDENKQNNDPSNLKLMTSVEHRMLHGAKSLDEHKYNRKNISGENNPFYGKHFTLEMKQKSKETKEGIKKLEVIDDAVLLDEFRNCESYESVAQKYGVSTYAYITWIKKLIELEKGVELNHKVVSVEFFDDEIDFYDITTEKYHNFFVGGREGVLVHNSGRFTRLDKKKFGVVEGVTDKEFYTNSFHVPVEYDITCYNKIKKEAPYHALTNAGHISYVELDGDAAQNVEAIDKIIRCMKDSGIGYGAINHPIDRDPECGYAGVINGNVCPRCGRTETDDKPFERLRRITGYLVGDKNKRFNDAKKAEESMRVKHGR